MEDISLEGKPDRFHLLAFLSFSFLSFFFSFLFFFSSFLFFSAFLLSRQALSARILKALYQSSPTADPRLPMLGKRGAGPPRSRRRIRVKLPKVLQAIKKRLVGGNGASAPERSPLCHYADFLMDSKG